MCLWISATEVWKVLEKLENLSLLRLGLQSVHLDPVCSFACSKLFLSLENICFLCTFCATAWKHYFLWPQLPVITSAEEFSRNGEPEELETPKPNGVEDVLECGNLDPQGNRSLSLYGLRSWVWGGQHSSLHEWNRLKTQAWLEVPRQSTWL